MSFMQTQSHFLMTAALEKLFKPRLNVAKKGFLWGSVAPDIPLLGLSLGGLAYFSGYKGWEIRRAAKHMFDHLYFNDSWWIALHNILHSPTLLILALAAIKLLRKENHTMMWFLFACLFHAIVDVLTHFDDGPVLLFPFNWDYRFSSPVSYWDPKHFGREFTFFETVLDALLLLYLIVPPLKKWWLNRRLST